MDLQELRGQIDKIDAAIVDLYEKRMGICEKVAEYKIETGKQVLDRQREANKLAAVSALAHDEFNKRGVEELFEQIMSMSRKRQYQLLEQHGEGMKLPFIGVDRLKKENAKGVYQ